MTFRTLLILVSLAGFHLPAVSAPQPACSDPSLTINLRGQSAVNSWAASYDCTVVQGSLFIFEDSNNPGDAVTSLAGLTSLQRVDGRLRLGLQSGLAQLTTLQGLNNVTSVGSLRVEGALELTDISALSSLASISCPLVPPVSGACFSDLNVSNTPKLTSLAALAGLSAVGTINNLSLIGIPLLADVTQLNNLPQAQNVFLNNIPLSTPVNQTELNHLAGEVKTLTLTSLAGVSALPVAPKLESIDLVDSPFVDLTDLANYPLLRSVSLRDLSLITEASLTPIVNLSGIANLTLTLGGLDNLTNLSGLAGLSSIGTLVLNSNANLVDLSGLSALASATSLTIANNALLSSLGGLDALSTINFKLNIQENPLLVSLDGLDKLAGVVGELDITNNPQLSNVRALRQVTSVGTFLLVNDNISLNECDVFNPIVTATGPGKFYFVNNGPSCDSTRQNYIGAGLAVAPTSFDFGSVNQGSSATQAITVTATGSPSTQVLLGNVRVEDNNSPPWFSVDGSSSCSLGQTLNSGESCVVTVNVAPLGYGPDQGDLVIPHLPIPSVLPLPAPLHAALQVLGDGQPSANLTPGTSLDFGSVTIGSSSGPQTVTVSNNGNAPLTINSITDDDPADFPVTNNCGGSVAVGSTCDITVNFTPARRGSISGTLTLDSSAAVSPQKLVLTGIGLAPPALTVSPANLAFPGAATGASTTLPLVVTNNGDDDLIIGQGAFSNADFSFNTDGCSGQTLAAGQTCQIDVRFAPSSVASITGTLSVASNDPASPTTIPLAGNGEEPAALQASPSNLSFGEVELGSSSDLALTLTNTGGPTTSVAISSIAASAADYSLVSDACSGQSLAGGSTCALTVRFTPSVPGQDNADLEITHSLSASSPTNVGLVGSGGTPVAYINPSSIDFGDVLINTLSAATVVTIGDPTASDLTIGAIVVDDPEFQISNDNCSGQTVISGNTCTFGVAVLPVALGGISGTISVFSDSGSSPDKVTLLANGVAAAMVRVSSPSLVFANVGTGGSGTQSLTITNAGGFALVLGQLAVSGSSAFALGSSDTCSSQTLAPGASCAVDIEYTRTSDAGESGSLNIPSNAPQSPDVVVLSAPAIAAAPVPVPGLSGPLLLLLGLLMIAVAGGYTPRMRR
jgi:hypothetical protein